MLRFRNENSDCCYERQTAPTKPHHISKVHTKYKSWSKIGTQRGLNSHAVYSTVRETTCRAAVNLINSDSEQHWTRQPALLPFRPHIVPGQRPLYLVRWHTPLLSLCLHVDSPLPIGSQLFIFYRVLNRKLQRPSVPNLHADKKDNSSEVVDYHRLSIVWCFFY